MNRQERRRQRAIKRKQARKAMGEGNGQGHPQPSQEEMQAAFLNAMAQDIFMWVTDQENVPAQAKENAVRFAVEGHGMALEFLQKRKDVSDDKMLFGIQITPPDGKPVRMLALKRFEDASKPEEMLATAAVLGMITSPYARAALAAHGYQIQLIQGKVQKKSLIHMPGA